MFMCSLTSKCKGFRSVSARSPLQDRRTIAVVAAFLGACACACYAASCDSTFLNSVSLQLPPCVWSSSKYSVPFPTRQVRGRPQPKPDSSRRHVHTRGTRHEFQVQLLPAPTVP